MPIRTVPGYDLAYHLLVFDEEGRERPEDGRLLREDVRAKLGDVAAPVTDVFLLSHGWKGDVPGAIDQYDAWLAAMAAQNSDREVAQARPRGFNPMIVGLHWPSLPWGDERLPGPGSLLGERSTPAADISDAELIDGYARTIADTPAARSALATIVAAVRRADAGLLLSPPLRAAYDTVYRESGLGNAGAAGPPGADQDGFDPAVIIDRASRAEVVDQEREGEPGLLGDRPTARLRDLLLMPIRQLSFWKMKDRARNFGEGGAHDLLKYLRAVAPAARFHLMGHSFGCIVMSGAVVGPRGTAAPPHVASLFLVQGALSLWSACPDVPFAPGTAGYFSRLVGDRLVRGSIATTRSQHDTAVRVFYPLGAQLRNQRLLGDDLPMFGGVGVFGLQGLGAAAQDGQMARPSHFYDFRPGRTYNLDATNIIAQGRGASGAHSDIAHPEVAHVQWQLALAAP